MTGLPKPTLLGRTDLETRICEAEQCHLLGKDITIVLSGVNSYTVTTTHTSRVCLGKIVQQVRKTSNV